MKIRHFDIGKNELGLPTLLISNEYDYDNDEFEVDTIEWVIHMMDHLFKLGLLATEHYYAVACDDFDRAYGTYLVALGSSKEVPIDKRNICMFLALSGAAKFIVVHNHPNNSLVPSEGDKMNLLDMRMLGNNMGIDFVGSFIVADGNWVDVDTEKVREII